MTAVAILATAGFVVVCVLRVVERIVPEGWLYDQGDES